MDVLVGGVIWLGSFQVGSHTTKIIYDLRRDEQGECLALFSTCQFGDTLPVDPWPTSPDIRDVVLESALGSQLRATGLDMGLHAHQSFNGLDRCGSLGSTCDREAHR